MIKVLLVTNDSLLERMLMVTLTINGLGIKSVSHLSDATAMLADDSFNALMLDTEFEDVATTIRGKGFDVPILIFGEPPETMTIKNVDYLDKPFEFADLKVKMNKLFRARNPWTEKLIELGHLKIDVQSQLVTVKDKIVSLGKMELAILVSLAKRTGKIVSKERLQMDLESQGHFFNTTIFHHIKELKRKLHELPGDALRIRMIAGEGYLLLAE